MEQRTEKIFAQGFSFKMKSDSPEWVVGSLSLKADEAIEFIKQNTKKGWVNMNINVGKSGKPYVELDTWVPKPKADSQESFNSQSVDSLPF